MPTDHRTALANIKRFDQLIAYLRDEMAWPIEGGDFDEMTFEYTPEELGIDARNTAKIQEIKRLRPLAPKQPWGIFFVKFEPKQLPVVALRRILGQVVVKKRASANSSERRAWAVGDLLFVSNYGEGDTRQISFAHFATPNDGRDLPTLRVLGWDNRDTALHLDTVAKELTEHLRWPDDEDAAEAWREQWRAAFTLRHREVVTTSRDLAVRLAGLARAIRNRIQTALAIETEGGRIKTLMKGFREALVHDLDTDAFADMYAQTIAYGLLSTRIADPNRKTADDFASHMHTNPFLRDLMETFLQVGGRHTKPGAGGINFDELGVSEVVELLDEANMEAVIRDFGDRNPREDPVIHFYELFLKEYDAKKRMKRGVFYTPLPVVSYIVRAVDELLRKEFGLADGLADTTTWGEMMERHRDMVLPEDVSLDQGFVQILDPATGTGTFLVEVIDLIHRTLTEKWQAQGHGEMQVTSFWNKYVPKHLLPRLHGYELLMAPYAIAHLKIGLKLYETGYRFGSNERVQVYLTNALESPRGFSQRAFDFAIPALAEEAQAVNEVKRAGRFTVVIGNPPYSGHSANKGGWIASLIDDYKKSFPELRKPAQAKWLSDDYVKFIRFAQSLLQRTGTGTLGFITNHSYLDNPTFRGMRQSLLQNFDDIRLLDLHGNSKKKERAPDGGKDENVFDIQQGVSIGLFVKWTVNNSLAQVFHADLWGKRGTVAEGGKYGWLATNDINTATANSVAVSPRAPQYLFAPRDDRLSDEYETAWSIPSIFSVNGDPAPGIITTHDQFAISWTPEEAVAKVERLLATRSEEEARGIWRLCSQNQWQYDRAKQELANGSWREHVELVLYRPFDIRATVFDRNIAVHRRVRVMRHMLAGENLALHVCRQTVSTTWRHVLITNAITDDCYVSNKTRERGYTCPLYVSPPEQVAAFSTGRNPNLDHEYIKMLSGALAFDFIPDGPGNLDTTFGPEDVFHYLYAVLHSPEYRRRYADFLKSDFPRVPLIANRSLFVDLIRLGARLVSLHLMEAEGTDAQATFPNGGGNQVDKVRYAPPTGGLPGRVWINREQYFESVKLESWAFTIGGYRPAEKWLKDRKGRTLSEDDIDHYRKIISALTETRFLMAEIDETIRQHGGWPIAFQTDKTDGRGSNGSAVRVRE